MIRTYVVVYSLIGKGKPLSTRCVTSPTYKTNFESLRKMISIRHGVDVEEIEVMSVNLLSVEATDDEYAALRQS